MNDHRAFWASSAARCGCRNRRPSVSRFTVAPKFVNVELHDLLRILSGLDVDVTELHGHARFSSTSSTGALGSI
jgi:hypothetical protein